MKDFRKIYFERYAWEDVVPDLTPPAELDMVVTIPSYREEQLLLC